MNSPEHEHVTQNLYRRRSRQVVTPEESQKAVNNEKEGQAGPHPANPPSFPSPKEMKKLSHAKDNKNSAKNQARDENGFVRVLRRFSFNSRTVVHVVWKKFEKVFEFDGPSWLFALIAVLATIVLAIW